MKKVIIINGPNLNMLGKREIDIYGKESLGDIENKCKNLSDSLNFVSKKYYSVRGKKIDKIIKDIQKSSFSKSTLGSCLIEKVNQTVIISKEQ